MKKRTRVFHPNKTLLVLLTVLSFLVCSLVFADGDTRKTTQAEKEFIKSTLNAFAKAIPAGPEGWEKTADSTVIQEPNYVSDNENQPLRLEYRIAWQNSKLIRDADVKFQEELIKMAQKPGFKGDGVDELQQKMTPHDVKVKIEIYANISSHGIYEKAAAAPAIAGGLTYQSQGGYRNGWSEGSTYVFFGKTWKMGNSSTSTTYIDFKPDKIIKTSTVVQNIVVRVQADSTRGQQIIQKIDWETLKKLIKN